MQVHHPRRLLALAAVLAALALDTAAGDGAPGAADTDWSEYGGPSGGRYSGLAQINTANVSTLLQVWRFDTGAGSLQTSPLVVGRVLYGYDPNQRVIALDGATGEQRWTFDAKTPSGQPARGLTWWRQGTERRLFAGVTNRLYALDPDTGAPITSFGDGGSVDLSQGLGSGKTRLFAYLTSPGVIFGDLIIVGFRTTETRPAAPGAIRAYDVRTGKLRWTFHTIPAPGDPGRATWPAEALEAAGGANNWAGMVVDTRRGIVFAPTGSAVDDFYGADRTGDNLYANTLLALDARTGKRLWHFQGVHHDIWDRDFPSPPVLVRITRGARQIDAVAQTTKHGITVWITVTVAITPKSPCRGQSAAG